jgi:S1-C subfamily serine protease
MDEQSGLEGNEEEQGAGTPPPSYPPPGPAGPSSHPGPATAPDFSTWWRPTEPSDAPPSGPSPSGPTPSGPTPAPGAVAGGVGTGAAGGEPGAPPLPPYGTPPYGTPPYGTPPYGTPPYGTPPYGTPYGGGSHWGSPGPGYGAGWHPGYHGYQGYPTAPPGAGRRAAVAAVVAAGVLVAALFGGLIGHDLSRAGGPGLAGIGSAPSVTSPPANAPANASAIAAAIDPCVVDVNTVISAQGVLGAGTGMVLSSTGEVLTNNHVVEGATKITATDIGNGRVYTASVVGYDRTQDVAVIQLSGASGLTTCPMGNSSTVASGLGVVAVGNANGAGGTPTYAAGTIVATNQTITASDQVDGSTEQLSGLLETDADIVSGDSGGPLVSSSGKIIGMDTAASAGFQFQNSGTQGYAIPINRAVSVARQIESGTSSATVHIGPTAFLGVGVRDASNGNPIGNGSTPGTGALIVQLVPGGPAAQAGLAVGDDIVSLDGHGVTSAESLTELMTTEQPGRTVNVTFVNTSGQQQTVPVVLGSGPAQ